MWIGLVRESALANERDLLQDAGIYGSRAVGVFEVARFVSEMNPYVEPATFPLLEQFGSVAFQRSVGHRWLTPPGKPQAVAGRKVRKTFQVPLCGRGRQAVALGQSVFAGCVLPGKERCSSKKTFTPSNLNKILCAGPPAETCLPKRTLRLLAICITVKIIALLSRNTNKIQGAADGFYQCEACLFLTCIVIALILGTRLTVLQRPLQGIITLRYVTECY